MAPFRMYLPQSDKCNLLEKSLVFHGTRHEGPRLVIYGERQRAPLQSQDALRRIGTHVGNWSGLFGHLMMPFGKKIYRVESSEPRDFGILSKPSPKPCQVPIALYMRPNTGSREPSPLGALARPIFTALGNTLRKAPAPTARPSTDPPPLSTPVALLSASPPLAAAGRWCGPDPNATFATADSASPGRAVGFAGRRHISLCVRGRRVARPGFVRGVAARRRVGVSDRDRRWDMWWGAGVCFEWAGNAYHVHA